MKNLYFLALILGFQMTTYSCTDTDEQLFDEIENILPGNWNIDSFYMPAWGSGIRHNGDVISNDTILYDVGTISIPTFSTDTLNFMIQSGNHKCTYNYQNEELGFSIESIIVYDDEDYFIYFRNNIIIQTEVANWIRDSRILGDNFVLKVANRDQLTIHDSNENQNRVLYLSRE